MNKTHMDLLLVRHGRTTANAKGLLLGHANPPLDELGRQQAARLGEALRSGRFGNVTRVISSPLARTTETASHLGLPVEIDDRFIELNYGEFDEVPLADVPAATWAEWRSNIHFRPPGGETLAELGIRVRSACESLMVPDRAPGLTVVVSHVSPIKAGAAWALGGDDSLSWRLHLDPASISGIVMRGASPVLSVFNETAHLATE